MASKDEDEGAAAGGSVGGGTRSVPPARMAEIREAAWRHFSERPYDAVGLEQIAADIGLARSTVQTYVGSKRSLYRYCLDRSLDELEAVLTDAVADGADIQERVRLTLAAFLTFAEERRDAWALIERHVFTVAGPFAADGTRMRARLLPDLEGLVIDTSGIRRTGATASAVLGSLHALADWRTTHPETPRDELVDQLAELVWVGLAAHLRK